MRRLLLGCVLFAMSCGGGPTTAPTSSTDTLSGIWNGQIVINGQSSPTQWRFTLIANAASYDTVISLNAALLPSSASLNTVVIGQQFHAGGTYPSRLGCTALLNSDGTASASRIDATFTGTSACDVVFNGRVTLSR